MQSINAGFQSLKTLIPHTDGEKLSKVRWDLQTAWSVSIISYTPGDISVPKDVVILSLGKELLSPVDLGKILNTVGLFRRLQLTVQVAFPNTLGKTT